MIVRALLSVSALSIAVASAHAQSAEDFYRGKQVSLIVSSEPGGGYDATARITARYLPKHLPGSPTIVVQNMPGAGGIRAPNYVYTVSPKDGSVFALMQNTIPFEPLVGNKAATFDATKLIWLGSPNVETGVLQVWHTTGVKSLDELKTREMLVGVPSVASTPAYNTRLLVAVLGLRLKMVPGYPSSNASLLSMEKGETEAYPNFYNSMMQSRPTWFREGKTPVLAQWGPSKEPALGDVPFLPDIVKDPGKLALLKAASASFALGRPFMMPPGVPEYRYRAMRTALLATFRDPAFVEDAKKIGFAELSPQSGEDIEKVVREAYASPPEIVEQLKQLGGGEGK